MPNGKIIVENACASGFLAPSGLHNNFPKVKRGVFLMIQGVNGVNGVNSNPKTKD
jgi:hypothetical protein